jgi:hypothetical protein
MTARRYVIASFPPASVRPAVDETVNGVRAAPLTLPSPPNIGGRGLRRVGEAEPSPTRSWVRGAARTPLTVSSTAGRPKAGGKLAMTTLSCMDGPGWARIFWRRWHLVWSGHVSGLVARSAGPLAVPSLPAAPCWVTGRRGSDRVGGSADDCGWWGLGLWVTPRVIHQAIRLGLR